MKLERIKCKPLERATNFCISNSYIIGCTGRKAVILDKQLNLIHTVEGLEYVYSAQLSPNESKLLLISTLNKFYIVDMQTFEKTRITVKVPYNRNLEGQGCWAFDGKSAFIPVHCRTGSVNSTLRRYYIDGSGKYEDYLADKYCITGIWRMEATHTYFLTGYDRQEDCRNYFIFFDGTGFQEFPLEHSVSILAPTVSIDEEKGVITISSLGYCRHFTLEGKEIQTISHPTPKDKTIQMSDVFPHLADDNTEMQDLRKELFALFGLTDVSVPETVSVPDSITKLETSSCGRYLYLASRSGFYLLDTNTGAILASVPEEWGVQNFAEFAPGLIALATWSGVKLYRVHQL